MEPLKTKINHIPVFTGLPRIKQDMTKSNAPRNIQTIKRSNKVLQALDLPSIMNINPRSAYNNPDELETLIIEEDIDYISTISQVRKILT